MEHFIYGWYSPCCPVPLKHDVHGSLPWYSPTDHMIIPSRNALWLLNSSPWYRWPIHRWFIDGLPIKNGGSFMANCECHNQMVMDLLRCNHNSEPSPTGVHPGIHLFLAWCKITTEWVVTWMVCGENDHLPIFELLHGNIMCLTAGSCFNPVNDWYVHHKP